MAPRRRVEPIPGPHAVYTFGDLLKLTRATKTQLVHWAAVKLIRPDVEEGEGTGHHNRYSTLNVFEAEIAATLTLMKLPTATIAVAVDLFRLFHEQCVALRSWGPLDADSWNEKQRLEYDRAMIRGALRRDRRHGDGKTTAVRYARAFRKHAISPEDQRHALRMAAQWHESIGGGRQTAPKDLLHTRFFLLVDPASEDADVLTSEDIAERLTRDNEVKGWGSRLPTTDAFIVVNLTAVTAFLGLNGVQLV